MYVCISTCGCGVFSFSIVFVCFAINQMSRIAKWKNDEREYVQSFPYFFSFHSLTFSFSSLSSFFSFQFVISCQ
jgi:hypothetical protein